MMTVWKALGNIAIFIAFTDALTTIVNTQKKDGGDISKSLMFLFWSLGVCFLTYMIWWH